MLMLTIILIILAIGLALTIVELFFIPGTTFVGILGVVFSIAGIVIAYQHFGAEIGLYILLSTTAIKLGILYWSLNIKAWTKFSLKSAITSRVNEDRVEGLNIGETGVAVTTLRPFGKAEFNNRQLEVKTTGPYLENGAAIRIREITDNQIIVEPTN
jgi:membrane-bound ClpP family serine protease